MERSRILGAGVWTVVGLAAAFAVVGATSNRHCATATKADATVAQAPACCAQDVKAAPAVAVAAPSAAKPTTAPGAKPAVRTSTGVNGLVVALDPESGELGMPSTTQMEQLEAAQQLLPSDDLNHSDAGLPVKHYADGSMSVDLQGRFQEFATVRIAPNGKRIIGCADRAALDTPITLPASGALEEK